MDVLVVNLINNFKIFYGDPVLGPVIPRAPFVYVWGKCLCVLIAKVHCCHV